MKNQIKTILLILSVFACTPDDKIDPTKPYDKGTMVLNAGNFSDNNGTVSHIAKDGKVTNDIYQLANSRSLSGSISGYAEVGNKGIILVDNSAAGRDAIEIVDAQTFKTVASLNAGQVENPRNVIRVSDTKAYITCWDATGDFSNFYVNLGYVAVLDLATNQISKKIKVQNGAEDIVIVGNEAYVGCTGSEKTKLTVINTQSDEVKQEVEVGANPGFLQLDANNKLWIFAGSNFLRMNTSSKAMEATVKVQAGNQSKSPSSIIMSGDRRSIIYTSSFYDAADGWKQKGEVHSFSISASAFTEDKAFINKLFGGGLAANSSTGEIYAGLIPSYKQAGFVFRYKSNSQLIDSVAVGVAPSKFYFK